MIKSIDGFAVAAIVRMQRQVEKKKAFLVLEGADDVSVMEQLVDRDACEIVNAFRKQNVVDAIYDLEDGGYTGILGIVDIDYDSILRKELDSENIICTSCHDLDVEIFMSPALEKYLGIIGDANKIKAFEEKYGVDTRSILLEVVAKIGAARLVALEKGLNAYFGSLELQDFVDQDSLAISDDIFDHLVERSVNPNFNRRQLEALTKEVLEKGHPLVLLCQGHDLAKVTGVGLRKALGDRRSGQTLGAEIEKGMRLAFDSRFFAGTALYRDIKKWEQKNLPWRILFAA